MKYIKILMVIAGLSVFTAAPKALAYNPVLSVINNGSSVLITVTGGNPNSPIQLSYVPTGSTLPTTVSNFGYTDSSGNYTTTVNNSSYGLSGASQVYVSVGGSQSNSVTVTNYGGGYNYNYGNCGTYGCNNNNIVGGFVLSQTSVSLTVGQTNYVTASMPIYNPTFYISSNSSPSVVSASISGSQVSLYGLASGSSTVTVCAYTGACGTIYVTVSGGGSGSGNVWFNPSNPTLYAGQSLAVSINSGVAYGSSYSYSTSYYISSNSNPSVVSANVVGTVLNLIANQSGTSSIVVCHSSLSFCGTIYVTVSGSGYGGGSLSFSQNNVNLAVGQTSYVTAYNYNSNLYVSTNSNPNVATVSISGSQISLYGVSVGSTNISVCGNNVQCGTLYVTVGGGYGGSLILSQTYLNLSIGQSAYVSATGYTSQNLYVSSNSNQNVVSTSVSGANIYFNALAAGSSNVIICTNYNNSCATVYVTVGGSSGSGLFLSQNSLNLSLYQSGAVTISGGGYGNYYYISGNSNPSVATVSLSGNQINVYGNSTGFTAVTVCQTGTSLCSVLSINVNSSTYGYGNYGNVRMVTLSLPAGNVNQYYNYNLQATGGLSPYVFSVNSGNLPGGMSLANNGQLSGTPQTSGTFTFSVQARDSSSQFASANYSLVINGTSSTGGGGVYYPGNGNVLGSSVYANGQLISENGTVYIVYKNTKTGFVSASVFKALGFKFANVDEVGTSGLSDSGYTVRSAYASHPWGSWIKSGSTIYFVHEDGLIPVPNWSTFINNGGQSSFVVPANHYDFNLPILSRMVLGDNRLN